MASPGVLHVAAQWGQFPTRSSCEKVIIGLVDLRTGRMLTGKSRDCHNITLCPKCAPTVADWWLKFLDRQWQAYPTIWRWNGAHDDELCHRMASRTQQSATQWVAITRCHVPDYDPLATTTGIGRRADLVPTTTDIYANALVGTVRLRQAPFVQDWEALSVDDALVSLRHALAIPGVWRTPASSAGWKLRMTNQGSSNPNYSYLGVLGNNITLRTMIDLVDRVTYEHYGAHTTTPIIDGSLDRAKGIHGVIRYVIDTGWKEGIIKWK